MLHAMLIAQWVEENDPFFNAIRLSHMYVPEENLLTP